MKVCSWYNFGSRIIREAGYIEIVPQIVRVSLPNMVRAFTGKFTGAGYCNCTFLLHLVRASPTTLWTWDNAK